MGWRTIIACVILLGITEVFSHSPVVGDEGGSTLLPYPPARLIVPRSGEVISGAISEQEFVWSVVERAVKYHLEVSPDRTFYRITREAYPETNRHRFDKLPVGTYFWRVSSIDDRAMEGRFSPVQYFIYPRQ